MKYLFIIPLLLLSYCSQMFAQQENKLTPVAAALFKNIQTKLTVTAQNSIAEKLGFVLSGNEEQPFAQDKESKDYPFAATVLPTDINKDGKEEIFISYGNAFTSGNTGSSIVLFIPSTAGSYTPHLNFPGTVPDVLATSNQGYPDLLIGGPGMEFPVYRWNGKTYALYKTIKDTDYDKLKKVNIEDLSKAYIKG
ncbi:hypothetical protein FC093_18415 [Ilyomonas limi]|uniref:VCBS repeat-containing protein n=1 Tax=Ilyomonas limi TaxID=2575867 RepID=A0A4U3KU56_9BACT|nr:hypothetical protein [Ilyomonas limi]TKK65978.1 hypothetical protein FC093_18415 [Ilyomonas limi]